MSYISDVFCDICDTSIIGTVYWDGDDVMVCKDCHTALRSEEERQIRRMPHVPYTLLALTFAGATTTAILVDSWPLVDGIATVIAGGALCGMVLKLYGMARGG